MHRILQASAVDCDWVYPRHSCAETVIVDQHSRSKARHVPVHVQQQRFHALSAGIDGCVGGGLDATAGMAVEVVLETLRVSAMHLHAKIRRVCRRWLGVRIPARLSKLTHSTFREVWARWPILLLLVQHRALRTLVFSE